MLELKNITLRRGTHSLLEGAAATLFTGRRVGLVGANGSGKTSLFKLLLGELSLDAGEVQYPRSWRLAQMAQEAIFDTRTALSFVMDGDERLREVQATIAAAEAEGRHERAAAAYAELEEIDGYRAATRAEQLLQGLGFTQSHMQQAVSDFSGGWRVRLNLARALMCPSDLLLLDEPTNHLDLDAIVWLEQWLQAYQGTLLVISHDRDFLDQVADEILHIEQRQLFLYRGNYSAFEQQRAERLSQQQAAYAKQQRRVAEIQRFVTRFRAKASKARQAQSRLKELTRMESLAPAHSDSPFNFVFSEAEKISDPLLQLREADLGYGNQQVLHNVSISLQPGARIGLLGINGAGKSTLIKALVGEPLLLKGERVCGVHLRIGYFAQHQLEALDMQASPLLHIQRLSPQATEQSVRNFLGGFDFCGDKALESVRLFSGGEKARLALAIIVWQKPNLLLLDEPTNHLDLDMRYALTVALQSYSGALVLISHDRHLLRNTVDEFYRVGDGGLGVFEGTLEDYQRDLKLKISTAVVSDEVDEGKKDKKARRQQAAAERQRLQPLTRKIQDLEAEMQAVQTKLAMHERELASTEIYAAACKPRLQEVLRERADLQKCLQAQEDDWVRLQIELEALLVECD